jgi:hypothetical protein
MSLANGFPLKSIATWIIFKMTMLMLNTILHLKVHLYFLKSQL